MSSVILYSGGMDSLMLAARYPDALRLYVDVKSRYSAKERAFLPSDVLIDTHIDLGMWERSDAIIPARNLFLALVAAQYADDIMLGATAGDQSRDKDVHWAGLSTELLGYMLSGSHFRDPPRHPRVLLPIKHMTKGELVREYLASGGTIKALLESVSCYDPQQVHCGHCKSCLRKWVALEYNDIRVPRNYWAQDPADPVAWADIAPKLAPHGRGWRTPIEDAQTRIVLAQHGICIESPR